MRSNILGLILWIFSNSLLTPCFGAEGSLRDVEGKTFTIKNFGLENGAVMPEVKIAYETYGSLSADGRNALLITHGSTSNHHAAGIRTGGGEPGWWDDLIGPGKAIDTNRLLVISSNSLGSSFGSTNPASINSATGQRYGPDFPDISILDIITAQKALLDNLGVKHLVAVAGPSYGGLQAFQWGTTFPDFMDGLVAVVSGPKGYGNEKTLSSLVARLS